MEDKLNEVWFRLHNMENSIYDPEEVWGEIQELKEVVEDIQKQYT